MKIRRLIARIVLAVVATGVIFSLLPKTSQAQDNAAPQALSECEALRDIYSYGKKYEDYALLITGKEGWVFRSKLDLRQNFEFSEKDTRLYRDFSDALKKRGTHIVLAVIPTRGIVAHEKLPQDIAITQNYDPVSAKQSYSAMIETLNTHDILAAGTPEPASGAGYFNHADQHWTVAGARDMARSIAGVIKKPSIWQGMPEQAYQTIAGKEVSYDGRFGKATEALCGLKPPPEKDREAKTVPDQDGFDKKALFEEKAAPQVVLVGTSNSRRDDFDANFSGALKEALSTDVLNAAISGGGKADSLLVYLNSESFQNNPPKFLIWEIPGYYDLGGESMRNTVRQAIAAAYGYCKNPLAAFGSQKVQGESLSLIKNIENKKIKAQAAYLVLNFDKPVKKNFSISFKNTDGKNRIFKFKRLREGHTNTFYYFPSPDKDGVYLNDVSLTVSKHITGLNVEARLCPVPPQSD